MVREQTGKIRLGRMEVVDPKIAYIFLFFNGVVRYRDYEMVSAKNREWLSFKRALLGVVKLKSNGT